MIRQTSETNVFVHCDHRLKHTIYLWWYVHTIREGAAEGYQTVFTTFNYIRVHVIDKLTCSKKRTFGIGFCCLHQKHAGGGKYMRRLLSCFYPFIVEQNWLHTSGNKWRSEERNLWVAMQNMALVCTSLYSRLPLGVSKASKAQRGGKIFLMKELGTP